MSGWKSGGRAGSSRDGRLHFLSHRPLLVTACSVSRMIRTLPLLVAALQQPYRHSHGYTYYHYTTHGFHTAMEYIYVLPLQQHKWYVGSTNDINIRYQQHQNGTHNVRWTREFPPIGPPVLLLRKRDGHHETNLTIDLMRQYGIDNVRGGTYTRPYLSDNDRMNLQRHIWDGLGLCRYCGLGHHIQDCPFRRNGVCWNCGEPGHTSPNCPNRVPRI